EDLSEAEDENSSSVSPDHFKNMSLQQDMRKMNMRNYSEGAAGIDGREDHGAAATADYSSKARTNSRGVEQDELPGGAAKSLSSINKNPSLVQKANRPQFSLPFQKVQNMPPQEPDVITPIPMSGVHSRRAAAAAQLQQAGAGGLKQ
ncbi:unnamed protein product, partial [Amoebophrya sp. A120]